MELSWNLLGQLAWTGLATSSYYALFAIAFSLVLKINRVWNFSQAGIMVFAYYGLYSGLQLIGLPTLMSLFLGLIVAIFAAVSLEYYGFRILRKRKSPILTFFIFTIVLAQFAVFLAELLFGTAPTTLYPSLMSPVFLVNGIVVSNWDLQAIATTLILIFSLYFYFTFTRQGQSLVAIADNPSLAEMFGINLQKGYIIAISISAVFITAGMYLFGTKAALFPSTPLLQLLIFAVIATIMAGLGNIFGAALAAIFLGLFQTFSILIIPSKWQILLAYLLIFVVIIFFPEGVRMPKRRIKRKNLG
jgi:branched-subunit amino acid ABC-type transport system permease component